MINLKSHISSTNSVIDGSEITELSVLFKWKPVGEKERFSRISFRTVHSVQRKAIY